MMNFFMVGTIYEINLDYLTNSSRGQLITLAEDLEKSGYAVEILGVLSGKQHSGMSNIKDPRRILISGLELEFLPKTLEELMKKHNLERILSPTKDPAFFCGKPLAKHYRELLNR